MFRSSRLLFVGLIVALSPLVASAQAPPSIKQVRIGLPVSGRASEEAGRSRNNTWAPVAVIIEAGAAGHPLGAYRLRIETTDLEEQTYQYNVAVPQMAANAIRTVYGYIVPGTDSAVFKVTLETTEGKAVSVKDKITRDFSREELLGEQDVLFFGIGAGLASMKRVPEKQKEGQKIEDDEPRGRRQFVFAEDVTALPDRWFGYDAVDVVVLGTGKVNFVNELAQVSESARVTALLEWVRRGGQLVISVGKNRPEVIKLLERMPVIDCKLPETRAAQTLPVLSQFCKVVAPVEPLSKVDVVEIQPGPGVDVLVRESFGPLIVEASHGLGRVVLVGFDLDGGEFSTWKGQPAFWAELEKLVSPHVPGAGRGARPQQPQVVGPGRWRGGNAFANVDEPAYEARTAMKRRLEWFPEVTPIPFGWVAAFLLLYIALVGPLDYYVLKKVFKRLEWTWVTFPVTVIGVSVLAYVLAYSTKGDELRINKIDLIEVDMHQPRQVYGHSWFTLFSPRAQSYTIGIEPADGTWTGKIPEGAPGPVITLLEGGDNTRRQASQPLFSQPYRYAEDATGLLSVPIPVWSTRAFTASWRAPLGDKPPISIDDDFGPIHNKKDRNVVVGRLTNNLPVTLKDVCLFYQDTLYKLGDLAPGEQRRVEAIFARDAQARGEINNWFRDGTLAPGMPMAPSGRKVTIDLDPNTQQPNWNPHVLLKPLMFYQRLNDSGTNAGLRRLDQSWRLRHLTQFPTPEKRNYRNEIILVARGVLLSDWAEDVSKHGGTASRLWLGKLPGEDETRPRVPGVMTQDTYLRVFIPVQAK